ncbi:MAG: helix-turn-helix transcriptional regulator [Peptococcaceae bacterium]|jgi:putative molybdopterin biosynthesis protein|nr:helix-turn-helix transcriptional regulator [Peptococcaceae bacterium]
MREDASLTPEEVASVLRIARNTVYELIKRGELSAYRVGRKIRVDARDVETYKRLGKQTEGPRPENLSFPSPAPSPVPDSSSPGMVICGQDVILDILTRHLEKQGVRAFRSYVGSMDGLSALYREKAHLTAVHLWDGDTDTYNVSYVRRLLPGVPAVAVHLAGRRQGFYVAAGNPKKVANWPDLLREDVRFVNREKGSGTRVLLDEKLRLAGLNRRLIQGYDREENSHLGVASAVARGEADVGLGNQKGALQVRGVDFLPLQNERYDLVMRREDLDEPRFRAVLDILRSPEYRREIAGLGDYDLSETGRIVAEL